MRYLQTLTLYLFCLLIGTKATAQADVRFVNEFLNIGVGAEAHGMFGSVAASVDDITAAYWNPAGLAKIEAPAQISAMHASWFGGIANYDYLSAGKRFSEQNNSFATLSLIRMGVDKIPNTFNLIGPDGSVNYDRVEEFSAADYAFLVSYGQDLGIDGLSIGGSAKVIFRSIGGFGSAFGFGFDAGLMYEQGNLKLGLMGRDITTTINNWSFNLSQEEQAVLLVETDIRLSSDGTKSGVFSGESIGIDPSIGLQIGYDDLAYFRAGIGNFQNIVNEQANSKFEFQPNIGLGIILGNFRIDYALTNIGSVSGSLISHIFSLSLDLHSDRL